MLWGMEKKTIAILFNCNQLKKHSNDRKNILSCVYVCLDFWKRIYSFCYDFHAQKLNWTAFFVSLIFRDKIHYLKLEIHQDSFTEGTSLINEQST